MSIRTKLPNSAALATMVLTLLLTQVLVDLEAEHGWLDGHVGVEFFAFDAFEQSEVLINRLLRL